MGAQLPAVQDVLGQQLCAAWMSLSCLQASGALKLMGFRLIITDIGRASTVDTSCQLSMLVRPVAVPQLLQDPVSCAWVNLLAAAQTQSAVPQPSSGRDPSLLVSKEHTGVFKPA